MGREGREEGKGEVGRPTRGERERGERGWAGERKRKKGPEGARGQWDSLVMPPLFIGTASNRLREEYDIMRTKVEHPKPAFPCLRKCLGSQTTTSGKQPPRARSRVDRRARPSRTLRGRQTPGLAGRKEKVNSAARATARAAAAEEWGGAVGKGDPGDFRRRRRQWTQWRKGKLWWLNGPNQPTSERGSQRRTTAAQQGGSDPTNSPPAPPPPGIPTDHQPEDLFLLLPQPRILSPHSSSMRPQDPAI
uniref:Uncharacterized protein n=1 Tax=Oryza punctata TaxID=4537 RepID=A0A0E0M5A4_ORYPU